MNRSTITRSNSSRFSIILINQGADGRDGRPGQPGAPGKDGRDFTSMALLRDAIQENVQRGKSSVSSGEKYNTNVGYN